MTTASRVSQSLAWRQLSRLSHLSWALSELLHTCEQVRRAHRCVGPITPRDVTVTCYGVHRVRGWLVHRPYQFGRAKWHERFGHDVTCDVFGVSRHVMHTLIESTQIRGRGLLQDVFDVAYDEATAHAQGMLVAQERWEKVHARFTAAELFAFHCAQLVPPENPWQNEVAPVTKERGRQRLRGVGARSRDSPRSFRLRDGSSPG